MAISAQFYPIQSCIPYALTWISLALHLNTSAIIQGSVSLVVNLAHPWLCQHRPSSPSASQSRPAQLTAGIHHSPTSCHTTRIPLNYRISALVTATYLKEPTVAQSCFPVFANSAKRSFSPIILRYQHTYPCWKSQPYSAQYRLPQEPTAVQSP